MKKMNSLLKGFQSAKCKTQLRLGTSRIKLLKNKKGSQIASDRREVAEFLRSNQEGNAQLRVEQIIREQNLIEAYDLLSLYAEQIASQLSIIDAQKTCPPELKEAISTLMFASSRCAELPDFALIRPMFAAKYGKEFVSAAEELRPGCGVNDRVVEKLSVSRASGEAKLRMIKDIAAEHNVEWNPAVFERKIETFSDDPLDGPTKEIDDFPSVPNRKPLLNPVLPKSATFMEDDVEPTNLPHPGDDYRTGSQGARSGPPSRFMEGKVESTNSPSPVDDSRMNSQGARSGPPLKPPPGREKWRTDDLSFDDRHTDTDPERRETHPRRNSRRESDSFAPLASQARHHEEESRRNSIGVPREKSGWAHTVPSFGGMDESLPPAKNDRRESHGAEIDDFDASHRSDRTQSEKYDQYKGRGQVQEANPEPSSHTKDSWHARTSQGRMNHTSDEDEHVAFAKTRPRTDGGRRNQTQLDKDLEEVSFSTLSRKEGSGKTKPRNQDQNLEEEPYDRAPSRKGSGKARGQHQDLESDEHNLRRDVRRDGNGKELPYREDRHAEEQHLKRDVRREGNEKEWPHHEDQYAEEQRVRRASGKEGSHGRISGRGEGKRYAENYRRRDDSDEDSDHIPHRIDEPRRRDSLKNTPKYVDENLHNTELESRKFITTKTTRNSEDEYRESGKGTRRDSLTSVRMDNEKPFSGKPHYGCDEYDDDHRGDGARKPESRQNNFKGTSTRNSDRSCESVEEGSHQRTRRTSGLHSVEERRWDALDDPGSSIGKKYGREDPDALKASSANRRFDKDPLDFDDDNFTISSKAEKRMSLPGESVRDKSKFPGNRASNDYDDTVRLSGRRASVGPEEIYPVRGRDTEDPARSNYGEREKHSDRRQSAPLPKVEILEGRHSPEYSSQRDRSDRHRKDDTSAAYDDDRPPRFSNSKVGLQASPDDEHSRNSRAHKDRSDRPRKPDIQPRFDGDNPPPRFINVGKQSTANGEDLPKGRSSAGFNGDQPERFVNSPRRADKPLPAMPRARSNLHSVKTDPGLPAMEKTPASQHRKSQSTSAGQASSSQPVFMKPPDLDDLIQMFGKKGKKK